MYLSKMMVEGRKTLNPYHLHQLLWKAFPGMPREKRPFLFRVESDRSRSRVPVLMQSLVEPQEPGDGDVTLVACKAFQPQLQRGETLRFALCANPVKRLKEERCRVPYIREDEQREWLGRKLEGVGELIECRVAKLTPLYFRKEKGGTAGKVYTATFEGFLRVEDPEGLVTLMGSGIGPAKSFGCGLLTVSRR